MKHTMLVSALLVAPVAASGQDYDAGVYAYDSGDFTGAFSQWHPLAEQGDARAQFNIGRYYQFGSVVPQDFAEAAHWYREAAEQGHANAQNDLGSMYRMGRGITQHYADAAHWYRQAAEQGHAGAQNSLAYMYRDGEGVAQNEVVAHMWFNIASANKHPGAFNNREDVAENMTSADISEAQRRARACMESGYQDCE